MVLLSEILFNPISVCRAVEHEGIHGPRDFPVVLGCICKAFLNWSVYMALHIFEGDMRHVFGQNTQGFRQDET